MSSPPSMPVIRLPDLLKDWPMKRAINPHYESTAIESAQWLESFNILTPRTRAAFKLCNPSLLSALAYPHSSAEQFRLSCDMMSFFLLFDEFSDSASAGEVEEVVRVLLDVFAYVSYSLSSRLYGLIDDASSNPDKPRAEGETVFGIMFQSYWSRTLLISSPSACTSFIDSFSSYLSAVIAQATDRESNIIRNTSEYFEMRRDTIGTRPCVDVLRFDMDLPGEVVEDRAIGELIEVAIDMTILANDIASYNVEQSRGDDAHNLITVLMSDHSLPLQSALDHSGQLYQSLLTKFLSTLREIPFGSWTEEVEKDAREYVWGVGNWVSATVEFGFESGRYFERGAEVKESGEVELLPRKTT
ncbi:terpenoid synthase [Sistotremastrum niveocremeum HHB9708]|uniref:Terpene synthase n=1 Tax=Sistotremastrum niveocremeum HHB9708 TaxID=1314777 RepID=A0A164NME9_9AGAM|nr:terpenoid synthase [Sistotremastrum niveocremeum HHB9708]